MLIPVAGALIIGLMARYGSERIRGHGIPEAIESILINGSRVQPRLAILKPLSSAISIGSGGPFGAEGPIIMTGGAFGSHDRAVFPSDQRGAQDAAGGRGGGRHVGDLRRAGRGYFAGSGIAALRMEAAQRHPCGACQRHRGRRAPLHPRTRAALPGPAASRLHRTRRSARLRHCRAARGRALRTADRRRLRRGRRFQKLPIHWMWWPAIGGLVVGIGGLIFPQALGRRLRHHRRAAAGRRCRATSFAGILLVKSVIWMVSLGSGTSGGVLAPLLMMGGALGGVEAMFLPHDGAGFWPLVSMGAILGGTMRSPFTGIVFAIELTHDFNMLLPLLVAACLAHAFTVLTLKRSILTEKVARRGYHLSREYAVDPLEILFVREVMRTSIVALPAEATINEVRELIRPGERPHGQHLFPIIGNDRQLLGVITRKHLEKLSAGPLTTSIRQTLLEIESKKSIVAYPDEPLRVVVYRMVETGFTRMPVVRPGEDGQLVGMVSLDDLLRARTRNLEEERARERVLRLRLPFRSRTSPKTAIDA